MNTAASQASLAADDLLCRVIKVDNALAPAAVRLVTRAKYNVRHAALVGTIKLNASWQQHDTHFDCKIL